MQSPDIQGLSHWKRHPPRLAPDPPLNAGDPKSLCGCASATEHTPPRLPAVPLYQEETIRQDGGLCRFKCDVHARQPFSDGVLIEAIRKGFERFHPPPRLSLRGGTTKQSTRSLACCSPNDRPFGLKSAGLPRRSFLPPRNDKPFLVWKPFSDGVLIEGNRAKIPSMKRGGPRASAVACVASSATAFQLFD